MGDFFKKIWAVLLVILIFLKDLIVDIAVRGRDLIIKFMSRKFIVTVGVVALSTKMIYDGVLSGALWVVTVLTMASGYLGVNLIAILKSGKGNEEV